jgi:hypothetical protein
MHKSHEIAECESQTTAMVIIMVMMRMRDVDGTWELLF